MVEKNASLSPVEVEEPQKEHHKQQQQRAADVPPEAQQNEPFAEADARYRYRNKDPARRDAPVLLSWRISLFLVTSSFVQSLSYQLATVGSGGYMNWTPAQRLKFNSLVYYMLYLGPVFGFSMDIFRVFGERYRPSIIIGCVFNLVVCFIMFGKTVPIVESFYGSLILSWVMEVATMYMYVPMNIVTIRYANRCFYNSLSYEYDRLNEKLGFKVDEKTTEERARLRNVESTARVGTIMAQNMVWRTLGTFLYTIFDQFATGRNSAKPHVKRRWYVLMAGIGSSILIVQVLFLMKRKYFLDYNANDAKRPICRRLVHDALKVKRAAVGRTHKPIGYDYMFVLCFIFIYFMIPDTLYNTRYSFNSTMYASFGKRWRQTYNILNSLGSLLGAIAYAVWMILAYIFENRRHRRRMQDMLNQTLMLRSRSQPRSEGDYHSDSDDEVDHEDSLRLVDKPYFYSPWQAGTVVVVFAGCLVWAFGCFFHMFGEMGRHNPNFNFHVFLLFEAIIVSACIRFAFMPTLSLISIHLPFDYEAASFCLYSVATSGGGFVSSFVTDSLGSSFGFTYNTTYTLKNYWKLCLMCIFFQFFPMLIAPTLPKCRRDVRMNVENLEDWRIEDDHHATNCTHDVVLQAREEPQRLDTRAPDRESDHDRLSVQKRNAKDNE